MARAGRRPRPAVETPQLGTDRQQLAAGWSAARATRASYIRFDDATDLLALMAALDQPTSTSGVGPGHAAGHPATGALDQDAQAAKARAADRRPRALARERRHPADHVGPAEPTPTPTAQRAQWHQFAGTVRDLVGPPPTA